MKILKTETKWISKKIILSNERYEEITRLREEVMDDKLSYDEFDKLVSDDEYEEWSKESNRRIAERIKNEF